MGHRISLLDPPIAVNIFPGTPFSKSDVVAEERSSDVHLIHSELNPSCFIIAIIVGCSMVSKAFMKSNFKMMISCLSVDIDKCIQNPKQDNPELFLI
jgi:hypothetical protein